MPERRPDPEHDAVCASTARHLVIIAPPGTGKTHLAVRLAGLIAPTLAPSERVLLYTFSTQARVQLEREAARQLTPQLRAGIEVTNYHRFFWHGVRAYRRALQLPLRTEIVSRRHRLEALERASPGVGRQFSRRVGVLESLAEHAFPWLRDAWTPAEDQLQTLLTAITDEHHAGRVVFDDLGALFWSLLERFGAVSSAYSARYPVVIADEHQDASALQDAYIRRFGRQRLIVFADPMQLIHSFRGASPERLERHRGECDESFTLRTAHRWHGSSHIAEWLLAVRGRLEGDARVASVPAEVALEYTPATRGFNAIKPRARFAALRLFREGCQSIAVLSRSNSEVEDLRRYLSEVGLRPWQVGGEDFEEAREEIEQLPLFRDAQNVALHAVERLSVLVSTLSRHVADQVRRRLGPNGVNLRGAGAEATAILRGLERLYTEGPPAYFHAMTASLEAVTGLGHHLPRLSAVQALRDTAGAFGETPPEDLDSILERYSARIVAATHVAPRQTRGLFVMTVHQAKGKEFDAVIFANVSRRYFPDDEESRRLFYVAITRASRRWVVIAPDRDASPLLAAVRG